MATQERREEIWKEFAPLRVKACEEFKQHLQDMICRGGKPTKKQQEKLDDLAAGFMDGSSFAFRTLLDMPGVVA
jgi:hypothetical protein